MAVLDGGEIDDIVHQICEPLATDTNHVEILAGAFVQRGGALFEDDLRQTDDARQRRAQLVGDIGNEFFLHVVGLLQRFDLQLIGLEHAVLHQAVFLDQRVDAVAQSEGQKHQRQRRAVLKAVIAQQRRQIHAHALHGLYENADDQHRPRPQKELGRAVAFPGNLHGSHAHQHHDQEDEDVHEQHEEVIGHHNGQGRIDQRGDAEAFEDLVQARVELVQSDEVAHEHQPRR